jgi:hypothetical protein
MNKLATTVTTIYNKQCTDNSPHTVTVLRIRDILIRIRMRIRILESVPLTNGSGCGSGRSESIRILRIRIPIRNTAVLYTKSFYLYPVSKRVKTALPACSVITYHTTYILLYSLSVPFIISAVSQLVLHLLFSFPQFVYCLAVERLFTVRGQSYLPRLPKY